MKSPITRLETKTKAPILKFFLVFALMLFAAPAFAGNTTEIIDELVPLFGIIFVFAMPALIISLYLYYNYKEKKQRMAIIEKAIAAGQQVPEELFKAAEKKPKNHLQDGMIKVGLGIGLAIMLWILNSDIKYASIGAFILMIGIAELAIHFIQKNDKTKVSEADNKTEILEEKNSVIE